MRWLVAFLGAAVVACGSQPGGPGSSVPTETGVGTRATFALATQAGLLGLAADGRPLGHIVALPAGVVSSGPTRHPGGKTIVFALSRTTPEAGFGSDIYSANLDGTDLRPLVRRDRPNVFYATPAFDATGDVLYVHRRAAVVGGAQYGGGQYFETEDVIERIDLRSGERRQILVGAAEPTVSPDGSTLVYVRMDRGQQAGLWTAATDGTGAQPFFKTTDKFWFLQAPRVSPAGRQIVFSSAGRYSSRPAPWTPVASRIGGGGKLAHLEIPSELYLAPLDGTSLRSIGQTMDDVIPAWSLDGTRIAYVAVSVFFVVSATDGAMLARTEGLGFAYGDPVWLR